VGLSLEGQARSVKVIPTRISSYTYSSDEHTERKASDRDIVAVWIMLAAYILEKFQLIGEIWTCITMSIVLQDLCS
jgi:hypothetical protein